jgi:hypothetical protein
MYRDYTDRGKSPFGVGAFSESEVQNKFSIEGQGIELIMISPDVISNQEKADIKESKNTKAKKTTEVKAVLHSVKYSDSISTTTTKYGNNSQPNFGSLSRKKQNPFDVENYTAVTNFVDDNAFVNDSLKRDEKVAVKINRLASQNYLDHTKQFLKERYNIDVNYTNVEYNDKEELISIKAKVNCNDGFTGTISRKRNQPVKEFYIFRDYSETNKAPFGIDDDLPSSFTGEKGSSNSYKTTYVLLTPPTRGLSEVHFEDLPGTSNSTTASVNRVNLEKVKTFIINDQVIKLADIKSQFLVVDSYFFVDDETFKVKGELINGDGYFDYLKSQSKDKDDVYVQNINIIIFSNNKATFLNFKDIKVTQHKSEKE